MTFQMLIFDKAKLTQRKVHTRLKKTKLAKEQTLNLETKEQSDAKT